MSEIRIKVLWNFEAGKGLSMTVAKKLCLWPVRGYVGQTFWQQFV